MLARSIIVVDLSLKWKVALVIAVSFMSALALVRDAKHMMLFAFAVMTPFSIGTGLPVFLARPQHVGLSVAIFVQLIDLLVFALLLGHLGRMATHRAEFKTFPFMTIPALAWIIASALSAVGAQDPTLSLIQIFHMCRLFLGCVILANVIEKPKSLQWAISGLLLGAALQGMLGGYQALAARPAGLEFLGEASELFPLGLDTGVTYRASGTIGHPNGYAMYLAAVSPCAIATLFSRTRRGLKLLVGCVLALSVVGLLFSLSRGGWVGLVLASLVVLGLAVQRGHVKMQALVGSLVVVALALLGLALASPDLIASRVRSDDRGAAVSRLTQAQGALAVFQDNPVVGIGLNNWTLRVREYSMASVASYGGPVIVHNIYLLTGAETGLLGLATFVWFLITLMRHSWRSLARQPGELIWVGGAGLAGGFVALAVHGLVDYDLLANLRVFGLFWLLAAMVASIESFEDLQRQPGQISKTSEWATASDQTFGQ